jgi:hypothetical protein
VFLSETGALPLSGAIPDLTATTEQYMLLQQAYQSKARADLDRFTATLHALLKVRKSHFRCVHGGYQSCVAHQGIEFDLISEYP